VKAIHCAMPLFDYLNAADPTGTLVAKVYGGVHKVWTRMVDTGEVAILPESQWEYDESPEPTSMLTVIQFLQTITYAPVVSEEDLGSFSLYDHKCGPTIRTSTRQRTTKARTETILHEIAHAVQYALTGQAEDHGEEWTRIALLMGCVEANAWGDE